MARQAPADDDLDETLELTADMEAEPGEDEPGEDEGEGEGEGEGEEPPADEGEGETVIGFGDEDDGDDSGEADNTVIRRIRDRNKDLARENAELRRAAAQAAPKIELGPKPTLAQFDYDEDEYETALDAWKDRKARVETSEAEQTAQAEQANREWQGDLASFQAKRAALALDDFDEAIEPVKAVLSLAQQAVIVKAAQDSAAFSYALGRSDVRLAELAKIQDPIKFAAAVARMEGGIKVTKRRKAAQPDRPAKGSARLPGTPDKQLDKLEAEAERTGNRSAVIQYKKKMKLRTKAK
jgi:hypothetical protein